MLVGNLKWTTGFLASVIVTHLRVGPRPSWNVDQGQRVIESRQEKFRYQSVVGERISRTIKFGINYKIHITTLSILKGVLQSSVLSHSAWPTTRLPRRPPCSF